MDALVVVLIIFGIIFLIAGIIAVIFLILIGAGVFNLIKDVQKDIQNRINQQKELLKGDFSFNQLLLGDPNNYVTKNTTNDNVILSNNKNLSCSSYTWNFQTYNKNNITIEDAFIWKGNEDLIMTASSSKAGAKVILKKPTSSDDTLNRWVYKDFTICLSSNNKLCLITRNDQLFIDNISLNDGFFWNIENGLSSPNCKNN